MLKKIIGRDVLLNLESHPSLTSLKEVGGRLEFASNWEQRPGLNWGKYQNEIRDKYQMFNIKYIRYKYRRKLGINIKIELEKNNKIKF